MNKPVTAARKWVLPSAPKAVDNYSNSAQKTGKKPLSLKSDLSDKLKSEQESKQPCGFSVPSTEVELSECLKDPLWRICSGQLYKIMVKAPDGQGETVVPFVPNRAQRRLMSKRWHRNIILKARQLGFCVFPPPLPSYAHMR